MNEGSQMNLFDLTGKVAVITGSSRGIGRAIAEAYAAAGAHVAISGRDAARGAEVVDAIRAKGGEAEFVAADLGASVEAVATLATAATAALGGRIDILVNNAGVYPPTQTLSLDEATFDAVIAVNVRAPVFVTQAIAAPMVERGEGVIVNVSSWIATVGVPTGALYAASKATLDQLTRSWAAELGPSGIRVNAVAPGPVDTAMAKAVHSNAIRADYHDAIPLGRYGLEEELAEAIFFLCSERASYITGQTLAVDGGFDAIGIGLPTFRKDMNK
jgi:NAD(P)-dependent dehydrogenase (short-subunit alcohol dehydrogenase family)